MRKLLFFVSFVGLVTGAAYSDDASWTGEIGGIGPGAAITMEHGDSSPWAGWFNVTATNTGTEPWGDFHFGIFEVPSYGAVDNVDWHDASMGGFDPTSSQSPLTWAIDNVTVGATIDLFFYTDPVLPGETATFSVYNVNPDQLTFFGVSFYPTPVPEPTSLCLLALGGLLLRRR